MARPDRGVAQRYAAKKRRKRLLTERPSSAPLARGPMTVAEPLADERLIPEVPSSSSGPRVVLTSPSAGRPARSRAPAHRPFTAYVEEYRYIGADLRRVAMVAGGLLVAVILLSLIIR
jgi:hypothetical protein